MRSGKGSCPVLFLEGACTVSDAIRSDVGVIGLDVIGRNVALHLVEHEFEVTAMDWGRPKTSAIQEQATGTRVLVAGSVSELMASLRQPRTILIFSSEDVPLDFVLDRLLPQLDRGDLLMDAGESFFKDTTRHDSQLAELGIQFMGIGLAGGEQGARDGAIVVAGGRPEVRQRVRPLLEALAATVRGEPCVSYLETAAAAHFVKMVHSGVECALLQSLAETYELLERTLPVADMELDDSSGAWHIRVLNGYLMEIYGRGVEPAAQQEQRQLLEQKLESARNDALGRRAAESALELKVPAPTIEAATGTERVVESERRQALLATPFRQPVGSFGDDPVSVLEELLAAFEAGMMISYAQAIDLLAAASEHFGFQFQLHEITRAWRGCTRLRTALLDDITTALQTTPDLPGLLADDDLSEKVMARQENLRRAVWRVREVDTPIPALLASLDYLDSTRTAWMPANLIQVPSRHQPRR